MAIGHKKPILLHRGRTRAKRPKTFGSEEAAHTWAKAQGIKKYELEDLRPAASKERKIRVIF